MNFKTSYFLCFRIFGRVLSFWKLFSLLFGLVGDLLSAGCWWWCGVLCGGWWLVVWGCCWKKASVELSAPPPPPIHRRSLVVVRKISFEKRCAATHTTDQRFILTRGVTLKSKSWEKNVCMRRRDLPLFLQVTLSSRDHVSQAKKLFFQGKIRRDDALPPETRWEHFKATNPWFKPTLLTYIPEKNFPLCFILSGNKLPI